MNVKVFLVFCFAILSVVYTAVSRGYYFDKDHPGKCNVEGRILDLGTHQSPTECIRIQCKENGFVETATCGVKHVEGCEPKDLVDKTKDYPDCCLRYFNCKGEIKKF
ncbi:hypothetical protein ACFFRR_001660 [Megaselia abdita]